MCSMISSYPIGWGLHKRVQSWRLRRWPLTSDLFLLLAEFVFVYFENGRLVFKQIWGKWHLEMSFSKWLGRKKNNTELHETFNSRAASLDCVWHVQGNYWISTRALIGAGCRTGDTEAVINRLHRVAERRCQQFVVSLELDLLCFFMSSVSPAPFNGSFLLEMSLGFDFNEWIKKDKRKYFLKSKWTVSCLFLDVHSCKYPLAKTEVKIVTSL